jgi:hypothetical protein
MFQTDRAYDTQLDDRPPADALDSVGERKDHLPEVHELEPDRRAQGAPRHDPYCRFQPKPLQRAPTNFRLDRRHWGEATAGCDYVLHVAWCYPADLTPKRIRVNGSKSTFGEPTSPIPTRVRSEQQLLKDGPAATLRQSSFYVESRVPRGRPSTLGFFAQRTFDTKAVAKRIICSSS